jgi:hypothetical protein
LRCRRLRAIGAADMLENVCDCHALQPSQMCGQIRGI